MLLAWLSVLAAIWVFTALAGFLCVLAMPVWLVISVFLRKVRGKHVAGQQKVPNLVAFFSLRGHV